MTYEKIIDKLKEAGFREWGKQPHRTADNYFSRRLKIDKEHYCKTNDYKVSMGVYVYKRDRFPYPEGSPAGLEFEVVGEYADSQWITLQHHGLKADDAIKNLDKIQDELTDLWKNISGKYPYPKEYYDD
jgi:hypothetical protein